MPHRDTSVAYQSSYYSGSKFHTGTEVKLNNLAITRLYMPHRDKSVA